MRELPSCEGRDHDTNAELLPRVTLLRSLGGNGLSVRHKNVHTSLCDGSSLKRASNNIRTL